MRPEAKPLNPLRLVLVAGWLACLLTAFSGCTWQGYAVTRGIRTATGTRTVLHAITPVTAPLLPYRVIEMHPLENLVPAMPSELERYLNDAYMSGLPTVRLVHGKGTGVLRQVVRDYLAKTRLVDRFEVADAREGGEGATVAHIAL